MPIQHGTTPDYTPLGDETLCECSHMLKDVALFICDEISMVGSMKLAKINFRFQDIADGIKKREFMGGISFVASGEF